MLISQQHSSGRRGNTVWTPIKCLEASNNLRLHSSGRHGNTSKRSSEVQEESCVQVHPSGRRGNTVQTPVSVREVKEFPSQTRIWEDSYNRPDDMVIPSRRYP